LEKEKIKVAFPYFIVLFGAQILAKKTVPFLAKIGNIRRFLHHSKKLPLFIVLIIYFYGDFNLLLLFFCLGNFTPPFLILRPLESNFNLFFFVNY
jgi:hypothetical protein